MVDFVGCLDVSMMEDSVIVDLTILSRDSHTVWTEDLPYIYLSNQGSVKQIVNCSRLPGVKPQSLRSLIHLDNFDQESDHLKLVATGRVDPGGEGVLAGSV